MIFLGFFIFLFSFGLLGTKDVNMILEKYSEEGLELFDKAETILQGDNINFFYEDDILVINDCPFAFYYVYDRLAPLRSNVNDQFPYVLDIAIPEPLNQNIIRDRMGEIFARRIEIRITYLIQNPLTPVNEISAPQVFNILLTSKNSLFS